MDGHMAGVVTRHWRAGHWLADGSLDTVVEINRQCVQALAVMAGEAAGAGMLGGPLAWRELPAAAVARMASCPYLLVDAGFDDELRWRCLDPRMVHDQPTQLSEPVFTGAGSADFIRRVLLFGWYLARVNSQLARVALGMAPVCAERLCQLHLHDIDWLAQSRPGWVRPRWERNPRIWEQLLQAARDPDDERLARTSLRGLQLMAAGALGSAQGLPPRARRL